MLVRYLLVIIFATKATLLAKAKNRSSSFQRYMFSFCRALQHLLQMFMSQI